MSAIQYAKLIEDAQSIDNRYNDVSCVSQLSTKRRGMLSLVFKATDTKTGEAVALKFFDPDRINDIYRLNAFKREPQILRHLAGTIRCVNLLDGIKQFVIRIALSGGTSIDIPLDYFVTEWLEGDVDFNFLNQDQVDAELKLQLFRQILLAVRTIHIKGIAHRDLKSDNLRSRHVDGTTIVVIIDFGTAAIHDSSHLKGDYDKSVGAALYSSPEALVGFAGDREIGHATDIYALGCLLFELFNPGNFLLTYFNKQDVTFTLQGLRSKLAGCKSFHERVKIWNDQISQFRYILQPPDIATAASSLPDSISTRVSLLYRALTIADFQLRVNNLESVIREIDGMLRLIVNHKLEIITKERKRMWKLRRVQKMQALQDRLNNYLNERDQGSD